MDQDQSIIERAVELLPDLLRSLKSPIAGCPELSSVPFGQVRVIGHLFYQPRASVSEVAAGLGISLATASELIDKLVDSGWLEREINPADRRQTFLHLTTRATGLGDRVHAARSQQMRTALSQLEADERTVFLRGLEALVQALKAPTDLAVTAAR